LGVCVGAMEGDTGVIDLVSMANISEVEGVCTDVCIGDPKMLAGESGCVGGAPKGDVVNVLKMLGDCVVPDGESGISWDGGPRLP
jgi:hypothetical protein